MIRPLKMAVLLLSGQSLMLLPASPVHMTDLPTHLALLQSVIVLTYLCQSIFTWRVYQRSLRDAPPLLVSLVTNEPT